MPMLGAIEVTESPHSSRAMERHETLAIGKERDLLRQRSQLTDRVEEHHAITVHLANAKHLQHGARAIPRQDRDHLAENSLSAHQWNEYLQQQTRTANGGQR